MHKQRKASLGPWPLGIVNSKRDYVLPAGACLDALNIDFTDEGNAVSRSGYSETVAIDNGAGLSNQGEKVMIRNGSELGVVTAVNPLVITSLRAGLGTDPVSYAERGGEVWWSNGTASGRCNADNTDSPWAAPAPLDLVSVISGVGSLPPGDYRVCITHSMDDGEESHASTIESITLSTTGSIELTLPAAASGTDNFVVYCTWGDGEVLQRATTVSSVTASVSITDLPEGRQIRDRAFLRPLPAGDAIAFHNGRLLSLKGEFLYYSRPYDYGLYNPAQDFIRLGATGSIVISVESGVFVVADRTWFYAGTDIATAEPVEKLPFGAASGTAFYHPDTTSPVAGWYSDEGIVFGAGDGSVTLPQREKGFIAPVAQSGSAWVRERDGMTHVVISLDGTAAYNKKVSPDFTAARQRYVDDSTTLCMNLANGATSRYSHWHFNSYATIDGDEYGIDSVGMSLLEGSDDLGTDIFCALDCGRVGFGSLNIKSPECVYVAGKSSAAMVVDIEIPGDTTYSYPARTFSEEPTVIRHDGMKGLINKRKTWFSMVLRNQSGSRMEVEVAVVFINESTRMI